MRIIKEMKINIVVALNEEIALEAEGIKRHEMIAAYIKAHEGQSINKRIETALAKQYPQYCFALKRLGSLIQLHIWQGTMKNETSHLLGYDSEPTYSLGTYNVSHSGFEYYDCCHGGSAKERNATREAFIQAPGKLNNLVDSFLAAQAQYAVADALLEESGSRYALKEVLKGNQ